MSISPPTTTNNNSTATTVAGATNSTTVHHQTYWCHECDMSVLLEPLCSSTPSTTSTTTFPPICPHCRHDFLEQMDSFTPSPHPNPTNLYPNPLSFFEPFSPMDPINPSEDTFLLESPYLHRLIHHLMTNTNNIPNQTSPTPPQFNSPASKHAIESLSHLIVDSTFLDLDPSLVCPVCKDQFLVSSEAKVLPCNHTYHADCIVPWLEMNNSCPVCRYRLPSESDERKKNEAVRGRETFIGAARLDELLDDEQDLFGFTSILRNVVRRQQYNNGNDDEEYSSSWNRRVQWDNDVLLSPTQIGEAEGVGVGGGIGAHVERANSAETVSSWPRWPTEGGASGSGSGDGEIGVGVAGGGAVIKGDAVRS
ncbi:uncharacterized protein [Coffea arabica]|uniref:RING-type E3 ubiquitin transferase n=1 Tax=Coffea arabica TaxID=13443 RepID=A0A6P6VVY4_COFAR|nr:uncharacterized protein LOC113726958 [Coffea arabica]